MLFYENKDFIRIRNGFSSFSGANLLIPSYQTSFNTRDNKNWYKFGLFWVFS